MRHGRRTARSAGTRPLAPSTLGARLALLFLIALLPTVTLQTALFVLERRQAVQAAYDEALALAHLAAAELDRDIAQSRQLLAVFAEHPDVRAMLPAPCSTFAARLLSPFFTNMGAATLDGEVFCSAVRLLRPVSISDRSYFRRALASGGFAVGEYQIGRITGKAALNLGYPIRNRGGQIAGVAYIALDLAHLSDIASQAPLPPGSTLTVIDEDGTVLTRHPDPEAWVGRRIPAADLLRSIRAAGAGGTMQAPGLDGIRRLYGFVPLPSTGTDGGRVYVTVGIPAAAALGPANRGFAADLTGLLLVDLLTIVALWIGADRLVLRPVHSLGRAAGRLGAGDLSARPELVSPVRELQELSRAFDRMAEAVQQREAERDRAEERITQQLETLTALYAGAQRLTRSLDADALAREITRTLVTVFGARSALLSRAEPDGSMRLLARYPDDAPDPTDRWDDAPEAGELSGRAIRTGSPTVLTELSDDPPAARWEAVLRPRGIRSIAALPLISREHPFGAIVVAGGRADFFSPERIELLQAFANQAAAALENARLFEHSERRIARLGALRAIDQAITGSLDLRLSLAVLLEQVTAQLQVDAAGILLFNPHTKALEVAARRGFRSPDGSGLSIRLGEGFAGKAAAERRRVEVADLARADGWAGPHLVKAEGFVSYHAVPLIAKGEIKGVLEVCHRAPIKGEPEWVEFLEALAGQAAIAVDNATLFDELQRSHLDLILAYDTTLEGWSRALDLRDRETEGHTERVAALTLRLARAMGIEDAELVHIRRGALLHDIGKMGIPDSILLKPGPLTEDEWIIMRKHPVYALELLSPIAYLRPALDIPYAHHEKWDGTGYPRRLKETQIPLAARIFAVADVWDALTSDRPYRPAWPPEKALAHIREQAGRHFDPAVVEAFLRALPAMKGSAS